jgi:hypothetical protein
VELRGQRDGDVEAPVTMELGVRLGRLDSALRVFATVAALALVVVLCFIPQWGNDFWLQARIGRWIVENGHIPRTVLFPFTEVRDNAFNVHEWLPSILFHGLDSTLGYDRLILVLGTAGLLLFGGVFLSVRQLTGSHAWALALALVAMANASYRHVLRPELIALVLTVALLYLLATVRDGRGAARLWWVVPIGVVWANSHGSFILGVMVCSAFAAGEGAEALWRHWTALKWAALREGWKAARAYVLAAVAMGVGSLFNPLGLQLWEFVFTLSASEVTKFAIYEWQPTLSPGFMSDRPFAIFVFACLLTATVMVWQRNRLRPTSVLLFLLFLAMALTRLRHVVFFGFAAAVVCAMVIGRDKRPRLERGILAGALLFAVLGTGLAVQYGNARGSYPFHSPSHNFSEPMVSVLGSKALSGNVFNSYELGAELIYRAYPRLKPSIDSRIDSYGDEYFMTVATMLVDEPRLNAFLDHYGVDHMLLLWRDFEYIKNMHSLQANGWRMKFADHKMVFLTRKGDS